MPLNDDERLQYEQALLELRTLQRVAGELSRSIDLDEVLGRCLDLAVEAAHGAAGVIYLFDPARRVFRRVVVRELSDEVAPPILPEEGLKNALSGSSLQVEVIAETPNPTIRAAYDQGIRHVILLPHRVADGEFLGFVAVHFREGKQVAASTMQTLEAIARHESAAIANARTHQLVERRGIMANGLRELSERALGITNHQQLYQMILETAVKLTGNDRALLCRVENDVVRVVAGIGRTLGSVDDEFPANLPYLAEALADQGVVVRETIDVIDAESTIGKIMRSRGTVSCMWTALRHDHRSTGLLYVASGVPRHYEDDEREALQILSVIAGEAIEQVRALERLAEEKRRLDAVLEHLPIVVSVMGPAGELLNINAAGRAFAESFGTHGSWRDALEKIRTLNPDGTPVPREDFMILKAFRGETPPPRELMLMSTDGKLKYHVMAVAAPIRGPDGKVEAVVSGVQDVTSLRQLADAKDHFLRIASHELRSPLTALRASTSLLEMDPTAIEDPARRALLLERVQRQTARLTRLVEQLIDSVRLNATEPSLEKVETDLVALCKQTLSALPEGNRVELEADAQVIGHWDRERLEQVLSNLLSNAVRYSEGAIQVRIHLEEARAIVEVSDHGIGIPPEQRDRLFTPFFRASNAAMQSKGGLGLGLHIAHEIVRRHGGTLSVQSVLGEGSTFVVELPVDTTAPSG